MTKRCAFLTMLALAGLLTSCNSKIRETGGYTVKGRIEGMDDGTVVLAKLDLVSNESVDVDSTEIKNGRFTFRGSLESPYLHTLFFDQREDRIHFFLENSEIEIYGTRNDLENAKISGSREDSLFRSFALDDIFDRRKGMEIMLNYPDYCYAAFTAYYQFQIHNIHSDTLNMIMNGFSEPVRESMYYEHLNKLYDRIKKVAISQPAPDFSIPDTSGNLVGLADFRGSYVLIDFWASWCAPCRASNPKLIEVYRKFSDKNFILVGISLDKSRDQWIKAIETDELPWINLSNLEGWDLVSENYGVKAIPQNFLLDTDGIILDKNIEPELLIEKLDRLLAD